jgi:hypothetical protein
VVLSAKAGISGVSKQAAASVRNLFFIILRIPF